MKIPYTDLPTLSHIDKVIIQAVDLCLYQLSISVNGDEFLVTDLDGRVLRSHNKLQLQGLFQNLPVSNFVLRHQSAHDEMVGQPVRTDSNQLEVPLGNTDLAEPLPGHPLNQPPSGNNLH
ncbi:MAG: DUF6482 family protein [Marinobacterium sp.]|nr:DUF6482 family protein [Marinobacterium sp.]